MHAGDVFPGKDVPFMDTNNGGVGIPYGETIAKAVAGINNVDTVITGHSTVMTWADFVEFGEFNRALVEAVRAALVQGYFNYHAVPGTLDSLGVLRERVTRLWRGTLISRSESGGCSGGSRMRRR